MNTEISTSEVSDTLSNFLGKSGYSIFSPGEGDARIFIADIIRTALSGVAVLFLIMMIYSGYLWLTAGGNEEQVKKAKTIISRSLIGFAITLMAMIITTFVVGYTEGATRAEYGGAPQYDPVFP